MQSLIETQKPQTAYTVADLQRRIIATAELPLSRAQTLPSQAYTSEEFHQWEVDALLRGGWQCVAHVSQIPNAGDFLNLDLLGEPLIVVRGKDGEIRVLSRVCPHRAMDIMPPGFGYEGHTLAEARGEGTGCGNTRLFLCPYHAWTFEIDGRLKACPEMHEAEGFTRDDFQLKPFRTAVFLGFVFVNLDGNAPDLAPGLAEMAEDLKAFRLDQMQLVIAREWECEFNWKVLAENFMESYHHVGIHYKTLQPIMPARDTWTEQERPFYIRAHLPYRDQALESYKAFEARGDFSRELPPLPGLSEAQKSEWGLFLVYPTFLLATAPDRVIWYRIQPLGAGRIKLLTTTLVAPEVIGGEHFAAQRESAEQSLVAFHMEDMEACTAVQRGQKASGAQIGRLSHLEMPVWLLQRYLAARSRGVWPTEDRPAAASQRG